MLPAVTVEAEVERGVLAAQRWAGSHLAIPVQMIRHKDKCVSPTLAVFLETTRQAISASAADEPRIIAG